MDIRSLTLFQHLASSLHFGKTAAAFHVSPSTLSRSIQRLEEQLGSQLLIRDNRSVLLTGEGKKLLSYADQQISQFESLKKSLNQSQKELSGSLKLYCSVTASYSYLPPLLEKFRQAHPNIDINLDTGDAADGIDQIKNQSVDLAIAARPDELSTRIHFQTIATVPLAITAPTINCAVKKPCRQRPLIGPNCRLFCRSTAWRENALNSGFEKRPQLVPMSTLRYPGKRRW